MFIDIIIAVFIFVYVACLIGLGIYYDEHRITPSIWSIMSVFFPVINMLIAIYVLFKNRNNRFLSLREFIDELKVN